MKKITYRIKISGLVSLLIIASVLLFISCEEEESVKRPNPTISIISDLTYVSDDTTISVGKIFTIGINADYNGYNMLTNFIVKINGERYIDLGIYKETYIKEVEITKGLEDIEEIEFIIRDIEGNSDSTSLTITKNPNVVYGEIEEYKDIPLGAQNSTEYGSFFSLSNGTVYDLESGYNNSELIDIVAYYDDFDKLEKWILGSPGANIGELVFPGEFAIDNWETVNTTRYPSSAIDVTVDEFDSAQNDSILLVHSFAFDSGKRKAKTLEPGDIFSFVREDNLIGMFKVVSTSGTNSGSIIVDFKIQKR
jgi:hypothetical protein